jgi:hypothetical protein
MYSLKECLFCIDEIYNSGICLYGVSKSPCSFCLDNYSISIFNYCIRNGKIMVNYNYYNYFTFF